VGDGGEVEMFEESLNRFKGWIRENESVHDMGRTRTNNKLAEI
jgi:hypothetical protein